LIEIKLLMDLLFYSFILWKIGWQDHPCLLSLAQMLSIWY